MALIAGVWNYPQADSFDMTLTPARIDIQKLKRYLRDHEYFHEIIVLENDAVNFETLNHLLNVYIPKRIMSPKSRFLFAYSGHGMQDGRSGYILTSKATSLKDRDNAINLKIIKTLLDEVVKEAHHTLVLINSCFSGDLIPTYYGEGKPLIPKDTGAHVITAGSAGQLVYGHGKEQEGSDFFELILAGLDRRADTAPVYTGEIGEILRGDGIITTDELNTYLQGEFRRLNLDNKQMPQRGDIAQRQSLGSFFFVRKGVKVKEGAIEGTLGKGAAFGEPDSLVKTTDPVLDDSMSLGRQFLQNGELKNAIAVYTQVILKDPNDAKAYLGRGQAYHDKGEYGAAMSDYNRAIKIDVEFAEAYYRMGNVYFKIGEYDVAIEEYSQAIEIDDGHAHAYGNRALAYLNFAPSKKGRRARVRMYERAISDYSRCIRIDVEDALAYSNRGYAYNQIGKYADAILSYNSAIKIDPNDAIAYIGKGRAYNRIGKYDDAISSYNSAIKIDPNYAEAYVGRGKAYSAIGEFEAANADEVIYRKLKSQGQ